MADRYRLNLEAPFMNAASDPMQPELAGSSDAATFQRPANDTPPREAKLAFDTDRHLRRLPVPQRAEADYSGPTMARYIGGLETRFLDHVSRHAPRWHDAETRRVLRRWSAPGANHPAPSWATPRDMLSDARDYAAALLRERIVAKIRRLHDIRVARTLGGPGEDGPLNRLFHSRSGQVEPKIRQKI